MNTYGGLSGRSAQTCLGLSCHFVLSELQKQDPSAFGSKTCDQLIWMYTFILSCTSFLHHLQSKSFRIGSGHVVSSVTAQQKGSGPKTAGQLEALLCGVSMSQCLGGFSKSTPASCHRPNTDFLG